jgi:hypothetical protein
LLLLHRPPLQALLLLLLQAFLLLLHAQLLLLLPLPCRLKQACSVQLHCLATAALTCNYEARV